MCCYYAILLYIADLNMKNVKQVFSRFMFAYKSKIFYGWNSLCFLMPEQGLKLGFYIVDVLLTAKTNFW